MPQKKKKRAARKGGPKKRTKEVRKVFFTLRIDEDDADYLDALADEIQSSRNQIINIMIKGLKHAEEDSKEQGTFVKFYSDTMTALVENALLQRRMSK